MIYGSPAIDVGNNLTGAGVIDDRDGVARPQGEGFDVGAYEYGSLLPYLNGYGKPTTDLGRREMSRNSH